MVSKQRMQELVTSLTIGSFVITALTGILIFFHLNIGLVKLAHEWLSWVFVLGAAGHVFFNWRGCVRCFARPVGRITAAAGVLLLAGALLPLGTARGKPPALLAADALLRTPVATVAQVAKSSPEQIVRRLKMQGIDVASLEQTLEAIARENDTQPLEILNMVFEGASPR